MISPVIVALDYADKQQAMNFIDQINPDDCQLKIGNEMFTYFGPEFVKEVQKRGFKVFLDLKFNDIPNTVAAGVKAAAELGVWMVDVHANGGAKMMEAAKNALLSYGKDAPLLIAITVLTSMDEIDLQEVGIFISPAEQASRLAILAKNCGLDGIVCSAREVQRFRTRLGDNFKLVTPGIRPVGSEFNDQKRIMTPQRAQAAGANYLVIGRPITQTDNPSGALRVILNTLNRE